MVIRKRRLTRTEDLHVTSRIAVVRGAAAHDGVTRSAVESDGGSAFNRSTEPSPARRLVVFACGSDIGRAQMAALWFASLADHSKARAVCASSSVAVKAAPEIGTALKEIGMSLATVRPRALSRQLLASADLVITIGRTADRSEIDLPGPTRRREHWLVPDLAGSDRLDRARELRDLLRSRVAMLAFMEGWGRLDISREAARVTRPRRAIDIDGRP